MPRTMTVQEIRRAGIATLRRELRPVDTARLFLQFEPAHGDYSRERHASVDRNTGRAGTARRSAKAAA